MMRRFIEGLRGSVAAALVLVAFAVPASGQT